MKLRIFFLFLLFYSTFVQADDNTPSQVITGIQTGWGGEGVYYFFEGGPVLEGCVHAGVVVLEGPMSDKILSVALSAYHGNKPVKFRISGCFEGWMKGIAIGS